MDIILGSQFGDEGKGKVRVMALEWQSNNLRLTHVWAQMTDALLATNKFDVCARYGAVSPCLALYDLKICCGRRRRSLPKSILQLHSLLE